MSAKTKNVADLIGDLFSFPAPGRGLIFVLQRNFYQFTYTFWVSAMWVILEPVLYLFAIGFGLGYFLSDVMGIPYLDFYAPALLSVSGMFISFYESTYGVFTKLHRMSTYSIYLISPISPREIAYGEIMWGTLKGGMSLLGVSLILMVHGHFHSWSFVLVLLLVLLFCWTISSIGVFLSCIARSHNLFVYAQSFFILPMALFSGTYFPLEQLPHWAKYLSYAFPLTHIVMATRFLLKNEINSTLFINISALFIFAVLMTNLAVTRLEKVIQQRHC